MPVSQHSIIGDRYQVLRHLADGGFAQLFLARDRKTQRNVVVKLLLDHIANDSTFARRFQIEARLARAVNHPNVIRVLNFGSDHGRPYIVLEWIEGHDLKQLLKQQDRMQLQQALQIVSAVLSGLAAIHRAGIIHRDIKPHNILIGHNGRVVITDFGIARKLDDSGITPTGQAVGTPAYLAPEQAAGMSPTPAVDLYAVGVVLYEMLTGQLPFHGDSDELRRQHADERPAAPRSLNPSIPVSIEQAILRAIHKDPGERHVDAEALRRALFTVSEQPTTIQKTTQTAIGELQTKRTKHPGLSNHATSTRTSRSKATVATPQPSLPAAAPSPSSRQALPAALLVVILLATLLGGLLGAITTHGNGDTDPRLGDSDHQGLQIPTRSPRPTRTTVLEPSATAPSAPTAPASPFTVATTTTAAHQLIANIAGCEGIDDGYLQNVDSLSAPDGSFIHLQFHRWQGERTTLLPPGTYRVSADLAGRYWILGPGCSVDQALDRHLRPSIGAAAGRNLLDPYYVDWRWTVAEGVVEVVSIADRTASIPGP